MKELTSEKTRSFKKQTMVVDVISSLLLLLFLYTALSKIYAFSIFEHVLSNTPLIMAHSKIIAWILPAAELMIALLLFIPTLRSFGLYASAVLLLTLTIYLIYMVTFYSNLPCNCGGVIRRLTWPQHIAFNLFFLFASLFGIFIIEREIHIQRKSPP